MKKIGFSISFVSSAALLVALSYAPLSQAMVEGEDQGSLPALIQGLALDLTGGKTANIPAALSGSDDKMGAAGLSDPSLRSQLGSYKVDGITNTAGATSQPALLKVMKTAVGSVSDQTNLYDGVVNTANILVFKDSRGTVTDLMGMVQMVKSAVGGSAESVYENVTNICSKVQRGGIELSGIVSLTIQVAASSANGKVSLTVNDGNPDQTYDFSYALPIEVGNSFVLTKTGSSNTIKFVNLGPSLLSSASDIATYLANHYPVSTTFHGDLLGLIGEAQYMLNKHEAPLLSGMRDTWDLVVSHDKVAGSLYDEVIAARQNVDDSLDRLPEGEGTYAKVEDITDDTSGGIDIHIVDGLDSACGTYNLSSNDLSSSIGAGGIITLRNGSNTIKLLNRSGSSINTIAQAKSYLVSMYPPGSYISSSLSDAVMNGVDIILGGGAQSSTRARAAAISRSIGGEGSVADRLGNPSGGTTGLAALIKSSSTQVNNPVLDSVGQSTFNDASDFQASLKAFLAVFSYGTLCVPQGHYASLAELLNAITAS